MVTTRTSPGTARCEGLAEARPCSSRPREAVVNMHVLIVITQRCKTITLRREGLPRGRDAGISDEHPTAIATRPPHRALLRDSHTRTRGPGGT
jgi:hypothetical protein